ncbi:MAG: hypothetical protein AAF485_02045 [Chloroflexota bacterium]
MSEAPHALTIAWGCQRWGTLPQMGGYFQQPLKLMRQMDMALTLYAAVKSAERAEDSVEWTRKNPEMARLYSLFEQVNNGNNRRTN